MAKRRQPRAPSIAQTSFAKAQVTIDRVSDSQVVLEVRAHDAPALLYRIARCIAREGVVVTGAKISTLGVDTVDAFFVKESHGGELGDLTAQSLIRALEKELEPPSPDLPATLE